MSSILLYVTLSVFWRKKLEELLKEGTQLIWQNLMAEMSGAVLANVCCCGIITKNIAFHSQKSPGLDDKLYSNPVTRKQYLYVATTDQGLVFSFAEPAAQNVRTLRLSQDGRKLMHTKKLQDIES